MTLMQKFQVASNGRFRREYPATMRTMLFKESVTVPYTETKYGEVVRAGVLSAVAVLYEKPCVTDKAYEAELFTQVEARKIKTAEGPRYRLYTITNTKPGLRHYEDRVETGMQTLLKKDEAIMALHALDTEFRRTKTVAKDGAHTRKYFSDYAVDVALLKPQQPHGIFKI